MTLSSHRYYVSHPFVFLHPWCFRNTFVNRVWPKWALSVWVWPPDLGCLGHVFVKYIAIQWLHLSIWVHGSYTQFALWLMSRVQLVCSAPCAVSPPDLCRSEKVVQSAKSATSLRQVERCSCVHASVAVRPKQRQIGWWSWQQLFISGRVGLLKLPVIGVSQELFGVDLTEWFLWTRGFY